MRKEILLKTAEELGFENYKIISPTLLHFDSRFRGYCEVNYCGNYGKNYSCPPACGTPRELEEKTKKFQKVLVLQTITPVKDIMDDRETRVIKHRHNQMTWELIQNCRKELGEYLPAMAGPCGFCSPCAMETGEECRFPEKKASCLSAYCIQVDALAEVCKIPYYCENQVAFFSLVFFDGSSSALPVGETESF